MFPLSKNKERKEQGFTLIEILVAIFVLVIGIFGVMALFPVGIHKTSKIAKTTLGAVSAEVPLAYASYKYPENSGSPDYHIQDIVNLISGTDNTVLVPVDMSTPGNGTATSIAETHLFRQQTAVYKNYTTNNGTATFTYNSTIVSNVSNINTISVNHFICNIQNHIWYRVVNVNELAGSITIGYPYEYETTSAAYISTNTIVGLYNTMLTSH